MPDILFTGKTLTHKCPGERLDQMADFLAPYLSAVARLRPTEATFARHEVATFMRQRGRSPFWGDR